ncbi:Prephenate dehydratase domain-containing protein [Phytophthora infestans]|uniref:Prephenate dehydratase domain-containing protein n=1 Tax=Phytophthora infestans TaxID=4787 RepID=A0A8S9UKR3_PHYIN|nr:Prephenate dehydratase domain-containing protein [Phytophthora infestans]
METSVDLARCRRRRTVYEKLYILDVTRTWTPAQAATVYGVSRSTIISWRATEDRFRQQDLPPRQHFGDHTHNELLHHAGSQSGIVNVGYVGQRGTLAEIAVRIMFPPLQVGHPRTTATLIEGVGFAHVIDTMDALTDKEIDYCVLPTTSLLSLRPDFMLSQLISRPLNIVGEIACTMELCLSALPGTALRECDCVMSDSALLQKYEALILQLESDQGSPIVRQVAWDSAGACFIVREQAAHGIAAIASKDAARETGLNVLVDNLCDDSPELAQYLILGRQQCVPIQPRSDCALRKVTFCAEHKVLITVKATVPSPFAKPPPLLLERLDDLSTPMHVFDTYFCLTNMP